MSLARKVDEEGGGMGEGGWHMWFLGHRLDMPVSYPFFLKPIHPLRERKELGLMEGT